ASENDKKSVAMADDGRFIAVYDSEDIDGTSVIYGQRFSKYGEKIGTHFRISSDYGSDYKSSQASVAFDNTNNRFFVTWLKEQKIKTNTEDAMQIRGIILPWEFDTCRDGIQNGDETGVDCGGNCPNECQCETLVFEDDFNDGNAAGWEVIEGDWQVINGAYRGNSGGDTRSVHEPALSDYTMTGKLMIESYEANILFRIQNIYPGWDYGQYYQITNNAGYDYISILLFDRDANGNPGENAATIYEGVHGNFNWQPGQWYDFMLVLNGNHLEYYIDGTLQVDITDDRLMVFPEGKVGVKGFWGNGWFDDIRVTQPANCAGTCTDADDDGYATEGGECGTIDCDDNNPAVFPDAAEICGDDIDQDCDGTDEICSTCNPVFEEDAETGSISGNWQFFDNDAPESVTFTSEQVHSGEKSLLINSLNQYWDNYGIAIYHPLAEFTSGYAEGYMYDAMLNPARHGFTLYGKENGIGASIRPQVNTGRFTSTYSVQLYKDDGTKIWYNTGIQRTIGWHKFRVEFDVNQVLVYIDNQLAYTKTGSWIINKIDVFNGDSSEGKIYFDDIIVWNNDCPIEPTCTDGIQNGDETGVDCGGNCPNECEPCADEDSDGICDSEDICPEIYNPEQEFANSAAVYIEERPLWSESIYGLMHTPIFWTSSYLSYAYPRRPEAIKTIYGTNLENHPMYLHMACSDVCPGKNAIYSFGGEDDNVGSDTIIKTDLTTGTNHLLNQFIPEPIHFQACSYASSEDAIYVMGGYTWKNSKTPTTDRIYRFDCNTETLSEMNEKLPVAIAKTESVYSSGDNKIYIFGGQFNDGNFGVIEYANIYAYDISTGMITDTGARISSPKNPIPVIDEEKHLIYIFGGNDGGATSVDVFDINTQSLMQLGNILPQPISTRAGEGILIGKDIYLFSSKNLDDKAIRFDIETHASEIVDFTLEDKELTRIGTATITDNAINDLFRVNDKLYLIGMWLTYSTEVCPGTCTDFDFDGFAVEGNYCGEIDCDDNNPNIHPDSFEVCDGLDNDCDSVTDNNDEALCDDGLWCNGLEVCSGFNGCTASELVDCSGNNLDEIESCTNSPDGNPYTRDYFAGFTSTCDEETDSCSEGIISLTHACDKSACSAECEQETVWANYCSGDTRVFDDGICNLETCFWDFLTEDCEQYSGWGDVEPSEYQEVPIEGKPCNKMKQKKQQYMDYTCNENVECSYLITDYQWVDVQIIDYDEDEDGVCNDLDKCGSNVPENPWFAEQELKPNHYDNSNWAPSDANFGCSCAQVLYCKPGNDNGEYKFGCSEGTKNIWETQNPDSWAIDCQTDGVVAAEGIEKPLFENTDSDWVLDLLDGDADNDGIANSNDDMIEDMDPVGDPDNGIPDWHPSSKHNK
ncbi:MAG: DUF1080 domain-containing protein, partial [Nanoarchaeota archaeon]|nr:DUF1080 domain-containing protein [Nanoarchaeota archaeon]